MNSGADKKLPMRNVIEETFGYTIIILLTLVSGYVSRVSIMGDDPKLMPLLFSDWSLPVVTLLGFIALFSIAAFIFRGLFIDPSNAYEHNNFNESTLKIINGIIIVVFIVISSIIVLTAFFYKNIWFSLMFVAVYYSIITIWTDARNSKSDNIELNYESRFVVKIFFPVLSICSIYYLIGWSFYDPSTSVSVFVSIFSLSVLFIYKRYMKSLESENCISMATVVLSLIVPSSLFLLPNYYSGVIGGMEISGFYRPEFFLSILWSFILGVSEISKRPYLIEHKVVSNITKDSLDFYKSGSNWSSIIFLHFSLTYIFIFNNIYIYGYVFICLFISIAWIFIKQKTSAYARNYALITGFALPVLFIITQNMSDGHEVFSNVNLNFDTQSGHLLSILGVLLTIIVVLYSDKFLEIRNNQQGLYLSSIHSLLLSVPVTVFILVVVFVGYSIENVISGEVSIYLKYKLELFLLIVLIELGAIFILYFFSSNGDGPRIASNEIAGSNPVESRSKKKVGRPRKNETKSSNIIPNSIFPLIQIVRANTSVIAGIFAFISYLGASDHIKSSEALASFVLGTFVCMFGFLVNDIFDLEKDKLSGRVDKPIATGAISAHFAGSTSLILVIVPLIISVLFSIQLFMVCVLSICLLLVYSPIAKRAALFKGIFTGFLTCIPLIIGFTMAEKELPIVAASVVVLFITGREILIDVCEIDFDFAAGIRTIPIKFGLKNSTQLGWQLMLLALCGGILMVGSFSSKALLFIALIGLLILRYKSNKISLSRVVELSKIPMLLSIFAMAFI